MKLNLIRAFVVALAITGAAATAHSKTTGTTLQATTTNGLPPAACLPSDPSNCGIN